MILLTNQLIRYPDPLDSGEYEVLRILWIDQAGFGTYVIKIHEKRKLPVWMEIVELEAAILEGRASLLKEDPFSAELLLAREAARKDSRLTKRRDESWKAIQPLIEDDSGRIFLREYRGRLIKETAVLAELHEETICKYLFLVWRFGHRDALIPFYFKSGGRGKGRTTTQKKRGRPSKRSKILHAPTGINIDDERKDKMLKGLIKYYEKDKYSFTVAFEKMLKDYFPTTGLQPSLGQARYWYRKERSPIVRKKGRVGQKR